MVLTTLGKLCMANIDITHKNKEREVKQKSTPTSKLLLTSKKNYKLRIHPANGVKK